MLNPGTLAQTYGQIVTGYLSEAIILYKRIIAEDKKEPEKGIILANDFQPVIKNIETAFGDLILDKELQKEHAAPTISWQELVSKVIGYLSRFNMTFDNNIFKSVIEDMMQLGILTGGIKQKYDQSTLLYTINVSIFEENKIEEHCVSLEEALNGRLERFQYHKVAKAILLELTKQKLRSQVVKIPKDIRTAAFFKDYGRGTLLGKLRRQGLTYGPFMETVELLVKSSILTLGCDQENNEEFIIINAALKPFAVLQKLLRGFKAENIEIIEMEIAKDVITPFDKLTTFESLIGISRDLFFFSKFDPYAYLPDR